MKALLFVAFLMSGVSLSVSASEESIIKVSPLIGGAVTQRIYSLERGTVSGTVVRLTTCKANSQDASPCEVEILRNVTHGSIQEAIRQFDAFIAQDDGD
jgi:hypothetical protein